jgi:hypothetical protein
MRKTSLLFAMAALVAVLLPAAAQASPGQVIRDCADDGQLQGSYSNEDLRQARDNLPSDLDEYSDCREVIGAAIGSGGAGKRGGSNGGDGAGGSGATSAAAERRAQLADAAALEKATRGDRPSLKVGGKEVTPGSNGLFDLASASNGMPTPLLLALLALALLALAGAFAALRRRIPALARVPLPKLPMPRLPARVPFPRGRR